MPVLVDSGLIRAGGIEIAIRFESQELQQVQILLVNEASKRSYGIYEWPANFIISDEPESLGLQGRLRVSLNGDELPFSDVIVRCSGEKIELGQGWHLSGLFAFTEEQFENRFFRKKRRVADTETLIFALKNILRHYRLNPAHRCVASVILAYRAVDSGVHADLQMAKGYLEEQLASVAQIPRTGHERTDRYHLSISLLTALWHVNLALNDMESFIKNLDEAIECSRTIPGPMTLTHYNLCRAILLRGWLHIKEGRNQEAVKLHEYNFEFYKTSLTNMGRTTIHFAEQKETHSMVLLSMLSSDKIQSGKKNLELDKVFFPACRSRSENARDQLARNFARIAKVLARQKVENDKLTLLA
jgi:hypothetical protein